MIALLILVHNLDKRFVRVAIWAMVEYNANYLNLRLIPRNCFPLEITLLHAPNQKQSQIDREKTVQFVEPRILCNLKLYRFYFRAIWADMMLQRPHVLIVFSQNEPTFMTHASGHFNSKSSNCLWFFRFLLNEPGKRQTFS